VNSVEAIEYLETLVICNEVNEAIFWENAGVDIIFVDLETIGKYERQGHIDSVKSNHSIEDIRPIKNMMARSKILVRLNPLHDKTRYEVENVINSGADIIMLPMFKKADEIKYLLELVDERCRVYPLIETPEAIFNIDSLAELSGVEGYHFGLNDLHLALNKKFLFEVMLWEPFLDAIKKLKDKNVMFGIGGVSKAGTGTIVSDFVIREYYRLGARRTILSRSFKKVRHDSDKVRREVLKIQEIYQNAKEIDLFENRKILKKKILEVVEHVDKKSI